MQFKHLLYTIVSLALASGVLSTPLSADIAPRTNQDLQALDLLKRSFPDHTHFSKDAVLIARYLDSVVLNQRALPQFEPRAAKPAAPKAAAPKAAPKAGSKSGKGKSPACSAKGGKRLRAREDLCIPDKATIAAAIGGNPQKYFFYARDADETHIDVEKVDTFMKAHKEYAGYLTLAGGALKVQENWDRGEPEFWHRASQAFAEKAEGTVYVLLPSSVPGTSMWNIEKPILMASGKVKNIIQVDRNNKKTALKGSVPK
ncbi:hypothetical protein MMC30_002183 [Trapelia coarctata]|nr:hypothetical protein [Trapelia coarctata]